MTTRRTLCPLAIDLGIYALIILITWRYRLEKTKDFYLFLHEGIVMMWHSYVCEREYYSSSYSEFLDTAVSAGKQQRCAWGDICDLGFVPTKVPPGEADSSWTYLCREKHVTMVPLNASLLLFPSLCGLVYFSVRHQVLSRPIRYFLIRIEWVVIAI